MRPLTPAERHVLQCYADGAAGMKGVAKLRGTSMDTTRTHLKAVREKLAATHTAHAVAIGLRLGFIK
jgi:DNA-binding CsgD family transcriptional regulator